MGTLKGAVVVITGAGRGIGRAIAEELGQEGARVVVNYSKSKEAAEDLVASLQQNGSPEANSSKRLLTALAASTCWSIMRESTSIAR